jgi:hypothetical protein
MKVLISGLPLFSKRLAEELQKFDPASKYIFLDTYNSKWDQLKFFLQIPFSDCVISMNGVTDNSGSLNLVLKWKKKLILQWMGTDVLLAIDRFKNKTINTKYIDYSKNFVDADWLRDELLSVKIKSEKLHFKYVDANTPIQKYNSISIMSYVPQNRQDFYGMDKIIELALIFPNIEFLLFGLDKTDKIIPENIKLFGWVNPNVFNEYLRKTPIFLRLTEHDGFSLAVLEALSFGAEAITSFKSDFVHNANTINEIKDAINTAINAIEKRNFEPNLSVIEILNKEFNKDKIILNYIQKIKEIVKK